MSTPNPHEERAREAKAQRLAKAAVEALINTAAGPGEKNAQFWDAMGPASDETKARVVAILRMLRPVKNEGWNL